MCVTDYNFMDLVLSCFDVWDTWDLSPIQYYEYQVILNLKIFEMVWLLHDTLEKLIINISSLY